MHRIGLSRASAKVVKGKVKVAIGDAKLEAEGEAEKIRGKVQNALVGIEDTIRDA